MMAITKISQTSTIMTNSHQYYHQQQNHEQEHEQEQSGSSDAAGTRMASTEIAVLRSMSSSLSPRHHQKRSPWRSCSGNLRMMMTLLALTLLLSQPRCCEALYNPQPCQQTGLNSRATFPYAQRAKLPPLAQSKDPWDGDDIRWSSRAMRRYVRSSKRRSKPIVLRSLMIGNCIAFLWQTLSSIAFFRTNYPAYWQTSSFAIILKSLEGSLTSNSPFVQRFIFASMLAKREPWRFVTAGFLHGGTFHLAANMNALNGIPEWLETGLGIPLLLTAYFAAIVAGNIGHLFVQGGLRSYALGASGGICGLYGLMFASLAKMGNRSSASSVLQGMGTIILAGLFIPNVSNAGHIGGFIGGALVGYLSGPKYAKSYAMTRKNSVEHDPHSPQYRRSMGHGVMPTRKGTVPLPVLWCIMVACAVAWLKA
mmetsp:Transcript_1653/g.4536  ORF Transcript_1653/g.4536 Transcript_1653/m.4536 type:complete len:423 (-) Transcript_1653:197-1465(-)